MPRFTRRLIAVGAIACVGAAANADGWTCVNLHPTGWIESTRALGIAGGPWPVGRFGNTSFQAVRWEGNANGWQIMNPPGAGGSEMLATDNGHSVGWAILDGELQAGMWFGGPDSWTTLHPPNGTYSKALGCGGGQQVGYAYIWPDDIGYRKASLWSGTPESWVDLSAGGEWSQAVGTNGTTQVGWTSSFNASNPRAALWNGTAESYVDLHPAGTQVSQCLGISPSGEQQVGFTGVDPSNPRACIWSCSPETWVDLHPAGATTSQMASTTGVHQVGWSAVGGAKHASVWMGTAESWQDLHATLPAGFDSSQATGVWVEDKILYVCGYAHRVSPSRDEAKMWITQLPSPADFNDDGVVDGADLGLLLGDWGRCAGCVSDLNDDGVVDGADIGALLADWNL